MAASSKSRLDTELVRELANILREADLGELEIEHDGTRVRVTKTLPGTQAFAAPAPMAAVAPTPVSTPISAPGESPASTSSDLLKDAVASPMVGTAYLAAEPGADPFVKVGDKVQKGQTLMLIEAMKTFNPVEAQIGGTVRQILVTDAQPVEFGEPLMVIS